MSDCDAINRFFYEGFVEFPNVFKRYGLNPDDVKEQVHLCLGDRGRASSGRDLLIILQMFVYVSG
jgi:hypothetical protein